MKICDISKTLQVICITHLAQIACFGDTNYKIEKYDENDITVTSVKVLTEDEKTIEIARMIGSATNETSLKHAEEIIVNSNNYKSNISPMI